MSGPISALNKGIRFESSVGNTTNKRLENLTLSGVPFASGDLLDTPAGAIVLTLNPDKQTAAKTLTVLEGKYIDIALEFDGAGQFRFKISPINDTPTVTSWMAESTEHTLGVSYNANNSLLVVSTDGASTQRIADLSGIDNAANLKVLNPGNGNADNAGTYDGLISQLAFFKAETSSQQLDKLTINPDALRLDYASIELPYISNSVQGNKFPGEIQKISVTGSFVAGATEAVKGISIAEVQKISLAGSFQIGAFESTKGANITEVQTISLSGNYSPSSSETVKGNVTQEVQKITVSGNAIFTAKETTSSAFQPEVQKITINGTASINFPYPIFGVSISVLAGDSASDIANKIKSSISAIKLVPNNNIDTITTSGPDLIITYLSSSGNVSEEVANGSVHDISRTTAIEIISSSSSAEVQKLSLLGSASASGAITTFGVSTAVVSGDTASDVALKIVNNLTAIKALSANSNIDTITRSGAELTITYNSNLGNVPEAAAITGLGISTSGTFSAFGVSTPVASGDTASDVATKIVNNLSTIKGLSANSNIDTITRSGADLTITYVSSAGDVAQASAVSAVNGVSLSSATEVTKGNRTAEVQKLSLLGSASASGAITTFGVSTAVVSGDTASDVALKIVNNLTAIKALSANSNIDTITRSGAELTITYNSNLGNVPEAAAITGLGISTSGTFSAFGVSTPVASGDTASDVATKIVNNLSTIKGLSANSNIDTITRSGADLTITYVSSAGDVAQASAVSAVNGVSLSSATEVTKGNRTAEVQKLSLLGSASASGAITTFGVSTAVVSGDTASDVALKIVNNLTAIKALSANSNIDTITNLGAELTITYKLTSGDVAEASAITGLGISTAGSFSAFGVSTPVASGDTASVVAGNIASNITNIKNVPGNIIDTIVRSGDELTITYLPSAGDVAQASAVGSVNGISISSASEVTKGNKTAEVQKLILEGSASASGSITTFGVSTSVVGGQNASAVATNIVSNLTAIKALSANSNIDTITASGAELTITYKSTSGDVPEAAAITGLGISTAGSFSAFGVSTPVSSGDTGVDVATKIANNFAAIKAANPSTIDSISASGADLTITYLYSAGDVAQASAVGPVNGISLSSAFEVSKPTLAITSEIQKVVITGTTTDAGTVKFLGIDSAALPKNATPATVVSGIVTNKANILAGDLAKTLQLIDLTTGANAGEIILTFSENAGNVSNAAASASSNGVIFSTGTETLPGSSGVAEKHIINLVGTYKAGDKIAITIPGSVPVTSFYDVKSTDTSTNLLANSLATAFGGQLGPYAVRAVNGTLELTGPRSAGNLPDPTITFTTASGLVENNLQDYFDFTKLNLVTSSVQGTLGGTASFTSQTGAPIAVATQDYSGSAVVTPPTGPVSSLPVNGPIYARLKSYTKDSVSSVPKFTYELFVNKSAGLTTLSSVGFTLDFEEAKASFVSFVPAAGTLQEVNTLQAITDGKVSFQWASTAGVTDFSLPVAELTLSLKGTGASFNASTAAHSVGMDISNISVNSTFFKQTGTNLPLVISSPLDAERYTATGTISQVFTATNASTTVAPNMQAGTVVGYEVFGTQTNPAVRLDIRDNYAATKASPVSAQNASVQLDIIANSLPAVGSKFSMVVNLPNNATGATLTAAPGVTLIPASSVLSGTQFRIEGTYAAPAGVTTTTPTLGTIAMTLVKEHNAGSDFSISDLTFNGAASVGRSMYFGLSETNTQGVLTINNLPKGEMVINVFDNPLALTSATSLSSFITIEDARAVMAIASGRNNGALNTATAATSVPWSPSDYIAADWDQNGAVTAADALSMLNYIVSTDKSKTLDYIYIDTAANLNKSLLSATSVALPPVAKVLTHKDIITGDYNFGFGHTDINIIGILVGDLVK